VIERAQRCALLTARIAQRLLRDEASRQIAFTAGLLHHIGALSIATQLPDAAKAIAERVASGEESLLEAERNRLGATHPEIGAYLLGLWDLPHDIIEAVAGHHADWDQFTTLGVSSAVAIAASLSAGPHGEKRGAGIPDGPPAALLERLGVTETVNTIKNEFLSNADAGAAAQ
jgi:HD-like signal output (HDOD) protein